MNSTSKIGSNPFQGNVIAMKDVKDKTTRKGSLRPLFDCVEALNAAVDALQAYSEASPEDGNQFIRQSLETLTDMQIKFLEVSKEKIQKQNSIQDPLGVRGQVERGAVEPESEPERDIPEMGI